MNMFTRRNIFTGKADHMPVAMDRAIQGNGLKRDFVARRNELAHGNVLAGFVRNSQDRPGLQIRLGDGNLVARVEAQRNLMQWHEASARHIHKVEPSDTHNQLPHLSKISEW